MVLKLRHFAVVTEACVKQNRQQERRFFGQYQKKYLSSMAPDPKNQLFIKRKFDEFIVWYDEFTGMDEVRLAQKRVLEDEDNFRKAQEDRRTILTELTEVQQKLKDLYSELDSTNRGDDRYVTLVTHEHKLLKEEKSILEKFTRAEKIEREAFAALSSSVKLSHEKERAQSERTKYWSIIGSVLGTVLGIFGSSINNHFKMNELKQLVKNSTNVQIIECLNSYLKESEKIREKYEQNLKAIDKTSFTRLEELLYLTNKKLNEVEISLKNIEKHSDETISKMVPNAADKASVTVALDSFEDSLKKDNSQIKLLLFSVAVLSVLMPIVSRYS